MSGPLKIAVTGSAEWNDRAAVHRTLDRLNPAIVIHGARGLSMKDEFYADKLLGLDAYVHEWCAAREETVTEVAVPIDRSIVRGALAARDFHILDNLRPDLIVVFPTDKEGEALASKARAMRLEVYTVLPRRS